MTPMIAVTKTSSTSVKPLDRPAESFARRASAMVASRWEGTETGGKSGQLAEAGERGFGLRGAPVRGAEEAAADLDGALDQPARVFVSAGCVTHRGERQERGRDVGMSVAELAIEPGNGLAKAGFARCGVADAS